MTALVALAIVLAVGGLAAGNTRLGRALFAMAAASGLLALLLAVPQ